MPKVNLWIIFLTGLTTGGLTCLAVQGGLLATAITRPVVMPDSPEAHASKKARRRAARARARAMQTGIQVARNPWPVVYFLAAKLVAYTLLGALLGALGSVFRITPTAQAIMLMIAGLFMVATALNMLNVHPIFRYVALQPPRVLTRLVRNQAKSQQAFAPVILGLMTVLIPCGTTQAMEVLAIGSASPLLGALIMFFFVLGTSPTFFVLGFLATQLRGKLQTMFAFAAALLVLALGVVALDSGLKLVNAPFAPSRVIASLAPTPSAAQAVMVDGVQELTVNATEYGYTPTVLEAQSGIPIRLWLATDNTFGCARAFVIPRLGVQTILPETGRVPIEIAAQQPGRIDFTCAMGMYSGVILVN